MRILYLAHRVPYPPDKGEKIRTFHQLKFLAERHTIDLVCFAHSRGEAEGGEALKAFCQRVYIQTLRSRTGLVRAALGFLERRPLSLACYDSAALKREVRQALATREYDLIFVSCSLMAQYVPQPPPARTVIDFIDADAAKWAQYAQYSRPPLSWLYAREAKCLAQYERELLKSFDAAIVTTEQEARLLGGGAGLSAHVIGNGTCAPHVCKPEAPTSEIRQFQPYVLFAGTMDYRPNIDAVVFFAKEILPLIRQRHSELRFVVVGRDPTRAVRRLSALPGVVVTGTVPAIQPYLIGAKAVVAPFRIAQGVQNKIIEALAAGVPVVSTSKPTRAIDPSAASLLLVADTPAEFARKVTLVLEDPSVTKRSQAASARLREQFDWRTGLSQLETLLEKVTAQASDLPSRERTHATV